MLSAGLAVAELSPQQSEGKRQLIELEYMREVLGYCGLHDPAAVKGFLTRKRIIIQEYILDHEQQLEATSDARQAAYAEWQNRGLGGFRGWCRVEGNDYTSRLKSFTYN